MKTNDDIHGARILVVDDCWDTASSLTELFVVNRYLSVCWTTDGEAVCDLHEHDHYDLILLDMHMPDVSGLEVMQRLRMRNPGNGVSIIAMSGDSCCNAAALDAGAYDCMVKPFAFHELEGRIRNALLQGSCKARHGGAGQCHVEPA